MVVRGCCSGRLCAACTWSWRWLGQDGRRSRDTECRLQLDCRRVDSDVSGRTVDRGHHADQLYSTVQHRSVNHSLATPPRLTGYCEQYSDGVSVSLYTSISQKPHIWTLPNFPCTLPVTMAQVFLWQRCNTLSTSGFMDDVMFSIKGPYNDVTLPQQLGCNVQYVLTPRCAWYRLRSVLDDDRHQDWTSTSCKGCQGAECAM